VRALVGGVQSSSNDRNVEIDFAIDQAVKAISNQIADAKLAKPLALSRRRFNTAIAELMKVTNILSDATPKAQSSISFREATETFVKVCQVLKALTHSCWPRSRRSQQLSCGSK
jgi:leucyl-tRNA synthetase